MSTADTCNDLKGTDGSEGADGSISQAAPFSCLTKSDSSALNHFNIIE